MDKKDTPPVICIYLPERKVMLHTAIKVLFLFHTSISIKSFKLYQGIFFNEFAFMHDRTSITVYLPSVNISNKLLVDNQKSAGIFSTDGQYGSHLQSNHFQITLACF